LPHVGRLVPEGSLGDANGGYDVETALDIAPKLADITRRPSTACGRQSATAFAGSRARLPIILDEGVVSCLDLEEFIRSICWMAAHEACRCGGLTKAADGRDVERRRADVSGQRVDRSRFVAGCRGGGGAYDLQYLPPSMATVPRVRILQQPLEVAGGQLASALGPAGRRNRRTS
jgi:hypothetical protein